MNNDTAKIVLQADLSKSADAIAKQLPKLSNELAQRGKLKIQAVVDPASVREQAVEAMRQVQSLLSGSRLSLSLDMGGISLSGQLGEWMQKNTVEAQRLQSRLDQLRESLNGLNGAQGLAALSGKLSAASGGNAGNTAFACAA